MKFDTLVLGGGIVGVSVAVHLQQRGRSVALIDRKEPGSETSSGNAGLIQREGVYPYAFPRSFAELLRYALNRKPDARYHARAIPHLVPFLFQYWKHSERTSLERIALSNATLVEHCVTEHRALAKAADAVALFRTDGWIKVFRSPETQDQQLRAAEWCRREFGVEFKSLDRASLHSLEPSLTTELSGAVHYFTAESVSDPQALVRAYSRLFESLGGRVFRGDANTLTMGWQVNTETGLVSGQSVVIAMGPWSDLVKSRFGYAFPFAVKRGYHLHYAADGESRLIHPVVDADGGFLLAPMDRGIRLTTGIELGFRDSPKTPVQLAAVEPAARSLFPLGHRIDDDPWMGCRPCTPDMLPIIGPARRHPGLWFAFGHGHLGLTLGPVTGRIVAELMTTGETICDPFPFRVERFQA